MMTWFIFLMALTMDYEPMEIKVPNHPGFPTQQMCERVLAEMKIHYPTISKYLFCKQEQP